MMRRLSYKCKQEESTKRAFGRETEFDRIFMQFFFNRNIRILC